jgi:hypothetical protein
VSEVRQHTNLIPVERIRMQPHQFGAIFSPYQHTALFGGVACGKTFTGSHFAIHKIREVPHLTGFIGANSYDQLSQATLRELFFWLDAHGYEYVIDRRPPEEWGARQRFKKYDNILSVKTRAGVTFVFTRVLGDGDPLRGVQFSWYWIDETRDTPQNTHDIILSRLRESKTYVRGLITSTTNGKDWAFDRFAKRGNVRGDRLYGSMHIATRRAVENGIISEEYYQMLRRSYSVLMAAQELDALHVNVTGGRAYYAAGDWNRRAVAPWGDAVADRSRPLLIGCDFNFSPAPMCWVIGQTGPYGSEWEDHVHFFGELCEANISSAAMANRLGQQWPGFPMYQVYGDASGNRETTSNAGEHDFHQIAQALDELGCMVSVDADQANPHVRDRLENFNAKLKNAADEVHVTYNPEACPMLDLDLDKVGVKPTGKLDDGGDVQRTHASDGAGYLLWKVLPPGVRGTMVEAVHSLASQVRGSF